MHAPRIGIVVVAYNAQSTLVNTLDRIPIDFRSRIDEILVCDDASQDDTFGQGQLWASQPNRPRTHVLRHTKNLGYGGNQKAAYALAIEHGLDLVVLLHGDGQYAPECLPDMVAPFELSDCAAVFGSRMMVKGAARRGGMPLYKRWGNRILTGFENSVLGTGLSEFHSGFRAYRTDFLRSIPFDSNSDGFDFDTQIIAQILHVGGRIAEVPIPTYYGDEICYVNGLKYARDVVSDVLEYRVAKSGFGTCAWVPSPTEYAFKDDDGSSHAILLMMLRQMEPSRVLDLGCSGGMVAQEARTAGHFVVGVDGIEAPGVRDHMDAFFLADLEEGIPHEVGSGYDVVIAGDVIEHLRRPLNALQDIARVLRPGGQVLLSVPNFAHWYPRLRVALGTFGYDRRGILDETHLRFFTRNSLRRLVRDAGYDILEESATGLPLRTIAADSGVTRMLHRVDELFVRTRPTIFAYQYLMRLTPHAESTIHSDHLTLLG
jgi:SAM-dependent methyltransferase